MGAFAILLGNYLQPRFFAQFEFVGLVRSAGTEKPLPFGSPGNILNVRTIAVVKRMFLHQVLLVAVGTFNKQACCSHVKTLAHPVKGSTNVFKRIHIPNRTGRHLRNFKWLPGVGHCNFIFYRSAQLVVQHHT
jgi:hypothetical protein